MTDEETKVLHRYTPRAISEILTKIGDFNQYSTRSIEQSVIILYQECQKHINNGFDKVQRDASVLFHQRKDVGALIDNQTACSIVKCSFKDNTQKPRTVMDVKLAIKI